MSMDWFFFVDVGGGVLGWVGNGIFVINSTCSVQVKCNKLTIKIKVTILSL